MLALIRGLLTDITSKKQIPVLIIDEAHMLRLDVFAQLHTLTQFDYDAHTLMPMILSGQISLIDKLLFHTSRPFASRIVGRSHMEALQRDHMAAYLAHHLSIVGGSPNLFADDAVTAIHQSSGGLLRRAGNLARGALLAAAEEKCPTVTAEHVRLAATEIL
jgi:type II secretory pathway predicted ATPase ExeA